MAAKEHSAARPQLNRNLWPLVSKIEDEDEDEKEKSSPPGFALIREIRGQHSIFLDKTSYYHNHHCVFESTTFFFKPSASAGPVRKSPEPDLQEDLDAFVESAESETTTKGFQDWAGGQQVTLAIAFTDVVGSTAIGNEIRDSAMNEVRRAHFAQSRRLIAQFQGREIKTIGDSFMVAFKCVDAALDYAMALKKNPGHPRLQIRAGIHIGLMHVESDDVFGGTVNFAARVADANKSAEIWLSCRAKEDVEDVGAAKHRHLVWVKHDNVVMKGFPGKFSLWSVNA